MANAYDSKYLVFRDVVRDYKRFIIPFANGLTYKLQNLDAVSVECYVSLVTLQGDSYGIIGDFELAPLATYTDVIPFECVAGTEVSDPFHPYLFLDLRVEPFEGNEWNTLFRYGPVVKGVVIEVWQNALMDVNKEHPAQILSDRERFFASCSVSCETWCESGCETVCQFDVMSKSNPDEQ